MPPGKKSEHMDFGLDAAIAKLKASETANKVAYQACRSTEDMDYPEFPVERIMKTPGSRAL
jgi:hypothetical protein